MKKVLYYATVDNHNYDLPKEMPIPKKDDIIFINEINIKDEVICKVNYVGYHLNDLGRLIAVSVNCKLEELFFICGVSNSVKKDGACVNCKNCELYENENTIESSTYFCKLNEEKINDINEHYCLNFEVE